MNHVLIGQIAGLLALVQIIPYVISIIRRRTKPERTSFLIWFIVDLIGIISYISVGASTTIWTGLVFTLTGLLVFILSIKYGVGGFSTFDKVCFLLALVGIAILVGAGNALVALYFTTFVKFMGYLPTIKKAYFLPKTENTLSWTMCASASVLNLFALTTVQPQIVLPILCAALLQASVAYLVLFPKTRFKHISRRQPHRVHAFLAHPVFVK